MGATDALVENGPDPVAMNVGGHVTAASRSKPVNCNINALFKSWMLRGGHVRPEKDETSTNRVLRTVKVSVPSDARFRNWYRRWRPGRDMRREVIPVATSGFTAQLVHSRMSNDPTDCRLLRKSGATLAGTGAGVLSTKMLSLPSMTLIFASPIWVNHLVMFGAVKVVPGVADMVICRLPCNQVHPKYDGVAQVPIVVPVDVVTTDRQLPFPASRMATVSVWLPHTDRTKST
jgi:hypothetical protein